MITVNIGENYVRVFGHAGTAPRGQDLVCAGASMLLCALAARLRELEEAGEIKVNRCRIVPGNAEITWENEEIRDQGSGIRGTGETDCHTSAAALVRNDKAAEAGGSGQWKVKSGKWKDRGNGRNDRAAEAGGSGQWKVKSGKWKDRGNGRNDRAAEAVAFYAAGMRLLEEDNPGVVRVQ